MLGFLLCLAYVVIGVVVSSFCVAAWADDATDDKANRVGFAVTCALCWPVVVMGMLIYTVGIPIYTFIEWLACKIRTFRKGQ